MSYSSSSSPEQSGSSVKRPDRKNLKYQIEREIREQDDEESSDESLTERIKLNRAKFQQELRQIKESVLSESQEFQSSAKKLPSSVFESARSGTLDLSQSVVPRGKKDESYETRIKRLESELQNSVKSRSSQSSSGPGSAVSRKLHFDTAAKYEKLDEEANSINENLERLKKQLNEDKSSESRKKPHKNGIIKTTEVVEEESKFQQLEQTLLNEIQKLKQDNEEIKLMIAGRSSMEMTASYLTQKSNEIKPQRATHQSSQQPSQRLKELVNQDLTKLDVEMRLLQQIISTIREQVNRVQSKLQRSIQRKLSKERGSPQSSHNHNTSMSFSRPSPPSRQKPSKRSEK